MFEDEEVKGIKLTDEDQEQYKDFDMVVSARWQEEMCATTVFDMVNGEYDRIESRRRAKMRRQTADESLIYNVKNAMEQKRDCLVQGYLQKQSGPFSIMWNRRYYRLYPTRLEWSDDQHMPLSNLVTIENIGSVLEVQVKGARCLKLAMKDGLSERDHILRPESRPEYEVWFKQLKMAVAKAGALMTSGPKPFRLPLMSDPERIRRHLSPTDSRPTGGTTM
jgi:beta-adrenergic-receptor kinase